MFKNQVCVLLFLGLLALSYSFQIKTISKEGIPDDLKINPFKRIGNGVYYIETLLMVNWFEANERCHAMHSELITFETIEEWNAINQYLEDYSMQTEYWTSGNDLAEQFRHVWFTTGEPIKLKEIWAPGEPNNDKNSNERCDAMGYKAHPGDKPGLNDGHCVTKHRFICEKRQLKTVSVVVW